MLWLGEVFAERMLLRPRPGDEPLGVAGMEVPIGQPGWIVEPRTEPAACSEVITGPSVPVSESARRSTISGPFTFIVSCAATLSAAGAGLGLRLRPGDHRCLCCGSSAAGASVIGQTVLTRQPSFGPFLIGKAKRIEVPMGLLNNWRRRAGSPFSSRHSPSQLIFRFFRAAEDSWPISRSTPSWRGQPAWNVPVATKFPLDPLLFRIDPSPPFGPVWCGPLDRQLWPTASELRVEPRIDLCSGVSQMSFVLLTVIW